MLFAGLILSWHQGGGAPWWLALASVAGILKVFSAVGKMRRYNAWLKDWNGMTEEEEPRRAEDSRPRKPERGSAATLRKQGRKRLWKLLTWAAALALTAPVWLAAFGAKPPDGIAALWFASFLFLLARLLARLFRLLLRRGARRGEAKADAKAKGGGHVACLLRVPSSSPSRADAERYLPDYCARLLAAGNTRLTR
jgi:hypothetical protein